MFALRRTVCEALLRAAGNGPAWLCAGRQVAGRMQPWITGTGALAAAGPCVAQIARTYAKATREEIPSHLDDLPPTLLKQEFHGVQNIDEANDVVKRLLSLDMASQSDKLKIKVQQLVDKVKRSPDDRTSTEVHVASLTARIQNYKEHIQKHPKDKANKRKMLMTIDRRKKMLKFLRRTRYETFEFVCKQLDIEYTHPPEYYRRATKRWKAKKAFCKKVYEEVKKQKAAGTLLKKPRRFKASSATVNAG
ncbi:small ribosomal subunit protein uS15m [Gastrophryne carolinensis]